jgi:hypothetical protein
MFAAIVLALPFLSGEYTTATAAVAHGAAQEIH